jgi:threonine/homoserine/homoserine lactone efflux protein
VNELLVFLFATGISLYGSLMAGIVNVHVIYTALKGYKKEAIFMSIGGVLPEILYSGIALAGMEYLQENDSVKQILKMAAVPILLFFGLYFYVSRQKEIQEKNATKSGSFLKGLVLALLNPQLIVFWFAWLSIAYTIFDFEAYTLLSPKVTFTLGTAVGAFITLRLFIFLTIKYHYRIFKWFKFPINKMIGLILIGLALVQLFLIWI